MLRNQQASGRIPVTEISKSHFIFYLFYLFENFTDLFIFFKEQFT